MEASVARLIGEALRFPSVDPGTGYPVVAFNALARIAGLLRCLGLTEEEADGLGTTQEQVVRYEGHRIAEAERKASAAGEVEAWRALRHARSAVESVASDLSRPAGPPTGRAEADATIRAARERHVPALMRLVNAQEAKALSSFLTDRRQGRVGTLPASSAP